MKNACQSIFDANGVERFAGEWNPRAIYDVLTLGDHEFWRGKTVLDIGANTCGLSVELARRGALVTALEPDPYANTYAFAKETVDQIVAEERLSLRVEPYDLFSAHYQGKHDVVLCLGLLYHFRYPQMILDYLSTLGMDWLFVSTQVAEGPSLSLVNRASPGVLKAGLLKRDTVLTGWHPTRPLLERMLTWAGFSETLSLTSEPFVFPRKQAGLTNSAYYRARRTGVVDPETAKRDFYPR